MFHLAVRIFNYVLSVHFETEAIIFSGGQRDTKNTLKNKLEEKENRHGEIDWSESTKKATD